MNLVVSQISGGRRKQTCKSYRSAECWREMARQPPSDHLDGATRKLGMISLDGRIHRAAVEHLPFFITAPGETDVLFIGMVVVMLVLILIIGNLYFQLHALPERMAHRTNLVQMEVVAVLVLISLFTHNHLFWIAGLLLALIRIPDFSTPFASIASSLAKIAEQHDEHLENPTPVRNPPSGITANRPAELPLRSASELKPNRDEHDPAPEGVPNAPSLNEGN